MPSTNEGRSDLPGTPDVEIVWDASVPARDRAASEPAVRAFVADHARVPRGTRVRVRVASSNGQLRIMIG